MNMVSRAVSNYQNGPVTFYDPGDVPKKFSLDICGQKLYTPFGRKDDMQISLEKSLCHKTRPLQGRRSTEPFTGRFTSGYFIYRLRRMPEDLLSGNSKKYFKFAGRRQMHFAAFLKKPPYCPA